MPRRRDERGAVLVFVAVMMSLLIVVGAIAVDLGMQRVLRRDMQALADAVALDLARELDGRPKAAYAAVDLDAAKAASLARNGDHLGEAQVDYELGVADDTGFRSIGEGARPNAVRVRARGEVGFAFASGEGGATRSAVATTAEPTVCFSVGTRALTLDTTGGGLSPLLSQVLGVNLSAVGYTGLADLDGVSVPLAGLLAELRVGTVDEVASTQVTLADFVLALADVLAEEGRTAEVEALRAVTLGVGGLPVALADILALETGGDLAGLVAEVDVLDLLGAAVFAANGEHGIGVSVPGVAAVSVTEPPQVACGGKGTRALSAQIRIDLDLQLPADAALGLAGASVELPVQVGRATAEIADELSCRPEQVRLSVQTGTVSVLPAASGPGQLVLRVGLGGVQDLLGLSDLLWAPLRVLLVGLGLDHVVVDGALAASVGSTSETVTIGYPPAPALPPSAVVPASGTGSVLTLTGPTGVRLTPGENTGLVDVLGDLVNPLLAGVLGLAGTLVGGVVDPLLTATLNPLLRLLGARLGVAEVDLLSRPSCTTVRLVG